MHPEMTSGAAHEYSPVLDAENQNSLLLSSRAQLTPRPLRPRLLWLLSLASVVLIILLFIVLLV